MTIERLDHVNVRTANLEAMRSFYLTALELEDEPADGPRRGYRLSIGHQCVIHLIEAPSTDRVAAPQLEHFAFRAHGLAEVMTRLDRLGLAYNLNPGAGHGIVQLNLRDPDDNRLHLDFPIEEYRPGMVPVRQSSR